MKKLFLLILVTVILVTFLSSYGVAAFSSPLESPVIPDMCGGSEPLPTPEHHHTEKSPHVDGWIRMVR